MSSDQKIKKHYQQLYLLSQPRYRVALTKLADKELVQAILEIIYRVLNRDINISEKLKERLHKHRCVLRQLCTKSSLKSKKQILVQRGGFLEFLIPPIIEGLTSLISHFVYSNNNKEEQEQE